MIRIDELDAIGAAAVLACENIKDYVVVSSEAELKDLLDNVKDYPLLVCAFPSVSGDDKNLDNYAEQNRSVFYVLSPMKTKFSRKDLVGIWSKTQDGMKDLKQFFIDQMTKQDSEFYQIFNDASFDKRSIEPEYNFLNNIGWSLMFDYTTTGI